MFVLKFINLSTDKLGYILALFCFIHFVKINEVTKKEDNNLEATK